MNVSIQYTLDATVVPDKTNGHHVGKEAIRDDLMNELEGLLTESELRTVKIVFLDS